VTSPDVRDQNAGTYMPSMNGEQGDGGLVFIYVHTGDFSGI